MALFGLLFQFQYGAIGGTSRRKSVCHSVISIPVWCDWWLPNKEKNLRRIHFNSSMVRLVETRSRSIPEPGPNFNSSMVRLVEVPDKLYIEPDIFQFQYGAIGGFVQKSGNPVEHISIPVWCDWWVKSPLCQLADEKFQFQYGAIGGEATMCGGQPLFYFNSSMVRLVAVRRLKKIYSYSID